MAQFTTTQVEQLEMLLGYANSITLVHNRLSSPYSQSIYDRSIEIVAELGNIDSLLSGSNSSLDVAYVVEARSSKLSYTKQIAILKSTGSRLLRELAYLLSVQLVFNKYSSGSTVAYW
jgi:hypothetical protein